MSCDDICTNTTLAIFDVYIYIFIFRMECFYMHVIGRSIDSHQAICNQSYTTWVNQFIQRPLVQLESSTLGEGRYLPAQHGQSITEICYIH